MKDEFFRLVLHAVEHQPFMTSVARDGRTSQTIAQISEGEHGELSVALQRDVDPIFGSDDVETTITLPSSLGSGAFIQDSPIAVGSIEVKLHPRASILFTHENGASKRTINAESIALVEPVRAKTLTLWYEDIWAGDWNTNVDKEAVTISNGGVSKTVIPPHGANEFFIAIKKPEANLPPIEWDISDTHQSVIVRATQENPFVKIEIAPAEDRDIAWREYRARIWVKHADYYVKDIGLHVWRNDEAEMKLPEINSLEQSISHSLSFMNSSWCTPKVAIAWSETWSDSQWWGTWTPAWGAWKPTMPPKRNRTKNWMPIDAEIERVLEEVLTNIEKDHYSIVERYVHNANAMNNGDWASSVTASVSILQRMAEKAGFRTRKTAVSSLHQGIAQYLRSRDIDRPHYSVIWREEARRLIDGGEPHDYLVKAITELRNQVTAHWGKDDAPANAAWLAQQSLYYVESALRAELANQVPMWDRAGILHHWPIEDEESQIGE